MLYLIPYKKLVMYRMRKKFGFRNDKNLNPTTNLFNSFAMIYKYLHISFLALESNKYDFYHLKKNKCD